MSNVRMRFLGQYLPKRAILTETLDSLGYHTETDDPFFTGVDKRHWADDTESTLFMGTAAAKDLIDRHDVDPNSIDLIIFSALIGDYVSPQSASGIQHAIGATQATAITLDTGCASFVSGLTYGSLLIRSGAFNKVLVISVSNFAGRAQSKVKNASAIIPGDGAGAMLLESSQSELCALVSFYEKSFGQHHGMFAIHAIDENSQPTQLWKPSQTAAFCFDKDLVEKIKANARHYLPLVMKQCMHLAQITPDEIDALFTHQPNQFLLKHWRDEIGVPAHKHLNTLSEYGNLFQASIPVSMFDAVQKNRIHLGDLILISSFAFAGELASSALIRFG